MANKWQKDKGFGEAIRKFGENRTVGKT